MFETFESPGPGRPLRGVLPTQRARTAGESKSAAWQQPARQSPSLCTQLDFTRARARVRRDGAASATGPGREEPDLPDCEDQSKAADSESAPAPAGAPLLLRRPGWSQGHSTGHPSGHPDYLPPGPSAPLVAARLGPVCAEATIRHLRPVRPRWPVSFAMSLATPS